MFNRFFKKDGTSAAGPSGGSKEGESSKATAKAEMPTTGGFFNLPTVTKDGGGPSGSDDRRTASASSFTPVRQPVAAPAPAAVPNTAQPPSMFGGMALKEQPSPMPTQPTATPAPSLFSGLSVGPSTTAVPSPGPAQGSGGVKPDRSASSGSISSVTSSTGSVSNFTKPSTTAPRRSSAPKAKKKPRFKPGFGRQLSEESAAALQRGELPEEVVAKDKQMSDSPANSATSSPSVLAGLNVHTPGSKHPSTKTTAAPAATGSLLSGLTVRQQVPSTSPPAAVPSGSLLAGLNVHTSNEHKGATASTTTKSLAASKSKRKVPETPEEKLRQTVLDFEHSASQFRRNVDSMTSEEEQLVERRNRLEQQIAGYRSDLQDIEAAQEKASEEEDFEKAEAMNATMNSVKHCTTLAESDLRKVESELRNLLKSKDKAFAQQVMQTKGTLRELQVFHDEQETSKKKAIVKMEKFQDEEEARIKFEVERIDSEREHVAVNVEQLESEKNQIEKSVAEQCTDEYAEKETLLMEKNGIDAEIAALEEQLASKHQEANTLQQKLQVTEDSIDKVRQKFARPLQRIRIREKNIAKTKEEIDHDTNVLDQQKQEFASKTAQLKENAMEFDVRIRAVKKELKTATLLSRTLEARDARREQASSRKQTQAEELAKLREAACFAEQKFRMVTQQQQELQNKVVEHRTTIASAEKNIPRLEQEKKNAAAQRNFKEAGRISKDLKQLISSKEKAETLLCEIEAELEHLEQTMKDRLAEQADRETELKSLERDLEVSLLKELWEQESQLKRALKKIKRRREGSDGCLSPRGGPDFQDAAALLLNAELHACTVEIDELSKKHDMVNPNESGDESDDSNEEDSDEDDAVYLDNKLVQNSNAPPCKLEKKSSAVSSSAALPPSVSNEYSNLSIEEIDELVNQLESEIEVATENEDFDLAAELDDKIDVLLQQKEIVSSSKTSKKEVVTEDPVDSMVEEVKASEEDIRQEVLELNEKASKLDVSIEEATQVENYDLAAQLDGELEEVKNRISVLEAQLQGNGKNSSVEASVAENSNCDNEGDKTIQDASASGTLFSGLSVGSSDNKISDSRTEEAEKEVSTEVSPAAPNSLFSGLSVGNSSEDNVVEVETKEDSASKSLFSGMSVVAADNAEDASPEKNANDISGVPGDEDVREESVESSVDSECSSPCGSSNEAAVESSVNTSMFSGLSVSNSEEPVEAVHEHIDDPLEPVIPTEDNSANAASESEGSMFLGLSVTGPANDSTVEDSSAEAEPDVIPTDDSSVNVASGSEGSMFSGLSVTGPANDIVVDDSSVEDVPDAIPTEDTIATAASESEGSMFLGLSVTGPANDIVVDDSSVEDVPDAIPTEDTIATAASESEGSMFSGLSVTGPDSVVEDSSAEAVEGEASKELHESTQEEEEMVDDTQQVLSESPSPSVSSSTPQIDTSVPSANEAANPLSPVDMFAGLSPSKESMSSINDDVPGENSQE